MSEIVEPMELEAPGSESKNWYVRFNVSQRIEHWVFITSFIILGITGLTQKFSASPISEAIVSAVGGIENLRLIHHSAAIVMMLATIYHIGALGYRIYVRRARLTMLPVMQDIRNAWHALLYYIGRRKGSPQQGRYTFEEKIEYWAVVWGTVIMATTGFMLWNPIATTEILPGQFIPAAKVVHGLEAILAVLSIIIWHLYHVFIHHFNKTMYIGKMTEEEMLHEHPLELADIKAGIAQPPVTPEGISKRRRIYFPVYTVIAAILLVGVYFFVAYEETAIATIPPIEEVEIFVPLTPTPLPTPPPSPTPPPVTSITWDGGIGALMGAKCVACHNPNSKIGGLDLSDYQSALLGGDSGPVIILGDPENSKIVIVQSKGDHPGQFTDEELDQVSEWIASEAPEN